MAGPRRILVATDFSDQAERAAQRALALAPPDATVALLHVIPEGPMRRIREVLGAPVQEEVEQATLEGARERMAELRGRLAGTLTSEVVAGNPKTAISTYAREHGFELVVAGAYGQQGYDRLFSGVTAQKLVRTADRPVLLVRSERGADRPYQRVLVAVDFSEPSRQALEWALALCPQATIYVLHVFELPYEQSIDYEALPWEVTERYREEGHAQARAQLEQFLAPLENGRCRPLVRQGDPSRVILGQAQSQGVDLVAVGSRGQGAWSEILLGSVNLHLLQRGNCDLLTIRP